MELFSSYQRHVNLCSREDPVPAHVIHRKHATITKQKTCGKDQEKVMLCLKKVLVLSPQTWQENVQWFHAEWWSLELQDQDQICLFNSSSKVDFDGFLLTKCDMSEIWRASGGRETFQNIFHLLLTLSV